ncbi:hypothetical protein REPUB_Repub14bG0015900 [Reevesia pubescens]
MVAEEEESSSLQYTPTWVVVAVCFLIVLISDLVERGLHRLGKCNGLRSVELRHLPLYVLSHRWASNSRKASLISLCNWLWGRRSGGQASKRPGSSASGATDTRQIDNSIVKEAYESI